MKETARLGTHVDGLTHQSWPCPITGLTVNFETRSPKYDCTTLIVIFSSIRGKQSWLDFDGIKGSALRTNRSRLLFIYDDFSDVYTYYTMQFGSDAIHVATSNFIKNFIASHGYLNQNVIFAGMSKGASAAILHGTEFAKATIAALSPQMRIGSYLKGRSDAIFENMAGPRTATNTETLDDLIFRALENDADTARSIYLLTSPADINCYRELYPPHNLLANYTNRNIIVTHSSRAIEHATTIHYMIPTFLSLLGLLSSGLRPRFDTVGPVTAAHKAERTV